MRIAAIYDIHGNLPALEAVLGEIERERVDMIVVGGDLVWGPFPAETLDLLVALDAAAFIRGNADREVAERAGVGSGLPPQFAEVNEWCADQLRSEQRSWLASLPSTLTLGLDDSQQVLVCHGSPRSDEESITPLSSEERLRGALSGVGEPTILCGHTHMQFERRVLGRRIVNPGSVGLPYQRPGGAYWALLASGARERADRGAPPEISVEFRRTAYEVDAAAAAMRASGCPHVDDIFVTTLTDPPDSNEVARSFEGLG